MDSGGRLRLAFCILSSLQVFSIASCFAQAPRQLDPIWSLEIRDSKPVVTRNNLLSMGLKFPLPAVAVSETRAPQNTSSSEAKRTIPPVTTGVAILPISSGGAVLGALSYAAPNRVSLEPFNGVATLIAPPAKTQSPNFTTFDPAAVANVAMTDFGEWFPAPRENTGVLLTKNDSIVIVEGRVVLKLGMPGYEVGFARSAQIGAVCLFEPPSHNEPLVPTSLVVFDFQGRTLVSTNFPPSQGCHYLHVSNDGRWVTITRQGEQPTIEADEVLFINVSTGVVEPLKGMAGGYRQYSADDRFVAEVQAGFGKIMLFDLSSPRTPRPISRYEERDVAIVSASMNDDGSLLAAVLTRLGKGMGEKPTDSVAIFDRDLRIVATAMRNPKSNTGVTMAKSFLFVGFQRAELPNQTIFQPSQAIDLYDLRALR